MYRDTVRPTARRAVDQDFDAVFTPTESQQSAAVAPKSASLSADDLLQTVTVFQLAGGPRIGSLRYGSPGFLEVIGRSTR